jgi:hypothetical protein
MSNMLSYSMLCAPCPGRSPDRQWRGESRTAVRRPPGTGQGETARKRADRRHSLFWPVSRPALARGEQDGGQETTWNRARGDCSRPSRSRWWPQRIGGRETAGNMATAWNMAYDRRGLPTEPVPLVSAPVPEASH